MEEAVHQDSGPEVDLCYNGLDTASQKNLKFFIGDPEGLERKKAAIRKGGPSKLQVIADFDLTLTRYRLNNQRGQSCHSLLVTENEEVNERRQDLHSHYFPLEMDPTIPFDKKFQLMEEWWSKSHAMILEGGLTMDSIRSSVANANIGFREGCNALFQMLEVEEVPVLIFSAGLADIIEEVMRQKLPRSFSNVRVVSNRMVFDSTGRLTGFKGNVIHVLNKNEHAAQTNEHEPPAPAEGSKEPSRAGRGRFDAAGYANGHVASSTSPSSLKTRTNVVLLGDHHGDLRMSDGVAYENRITVGFLNDNEDSRLESYGRDFDIVILRDGPMTLVVELLKDLLQ